jgi:hypothetical protein
MADELKKSLDDAKQLIERLKKNPGELAELEKSLGAMNIDSAALGALAKRMSDSITLRKTAEQMGVKAGGAMPKLPAAAKKAEANPDKDADAELGEDVEHRVEDHMLANKAAEKKEGHKIFTAKKEMGAKGSPSGDPQSGGRMSAEQARKKLPGSMKKEEMGAAGSQPTGNISPDQGLVHLPEEAKKAELGKAQTKHSRCVEDVKRNSPDVKNPHAVCVAEGVKPGNWGKSEQGAGQHAGLREMFKCDDAMISRFKSKAGAGGQGGAPAQVAKEQMCLGGAYAKKEMGAAPACQAKPNGGQVSGEQARKQLPAAVKKTAESIGVKAGGSIPKIPEAAKKGEMMPGAKHGGKQIPKIPEKVKKDEKSMGVHAGGARPKLPAAAKKSEADSSSAQMPSATPASNMASPGMARKAEEPFG